MESVGNEAGGQPVLGQVCHQRVAEFREHVRHGIAKVGRQRSAGFRRSLPDSLLSSLADLVRAMNCYYSNLIEGHYTHPIDIERAQKNDYSKDARKRNLQLEARAHIEVQKWIDEGGLKGRAVTVEGICEIHRRFCDLLPEDLLWIENPETKERIRVVPGELRRPAPNDSISDRGGHQVN